MVLYVLGKEMSSLQSTHRTILPKAATFPSNTLRDHSNRFTREPTENHSLIKAQNHNLLMWVWIWKNAPENDMVCSLLWSTCKITHHSSHYSPCYHCCHCYHYYHIITIIMSLTLVSLSTRTLPEKMHMRRATPAAEVQRAVPLTHMHAAGVQLLAHVPFSSSSETMAVQSSRSSSGCRVSKINDSTTVVMATPTISNIPSNQANHLLQHQCYLRTHVQSKRDENLHDETPSSGNPSAPTSCEKWPRCWKDTRPYITLKQTSVVTPKRGNKMITRSPKQNIPIRSIAYCSYCSLLCYQKPCWTMLTVLPYVTALKLKHMPD